MMAAILPRRLLGVLTCLLLGACAVGRGDTAGFDATGFAETYHLPTEQGTIYAISDDRGRLLGWIYGTVHVGTLARPSLSLQALRAIDQARAIYVEYTDAQGTTFTMQEAQRFDAFASVRARPVRLSDAQLVAQLQNPPTVAKLIENPHLWDDLEQMWNRCGLYEEFGTEAMIADYLVGRAIEIGALETAASHQRDLASYKAALGAALADATQALPGADQPTALVERVCAAYRSFTEHAQRGRLPRDAGDDEDALRSLRNHTMADYIDLVLRSDMHPFIAIGLAHLHGHDNVLALLRAKVYRVAPLPPAPGRRQAQQQVSAG